MIYELLYTSAPAGLRPGSSGYCTVQSSRGIPAPTVDLLESLSGYRHVYTAGTPEAAHNPVNFGHYVLRVQGRSQHVLSRVSDCPLDHTGRSNKIGHHMVVDNPDGIPAGPAWLMQQPGWMIDRWDGQVTTLNTVRRAPNSKRPAGVCTGWKQATGDAGWAGVLAEAFQKNPDRKVFVIYKPGTNLLALFEEALALLPASRRWDVTFSTYGAALPATVDCVWNGVISGSQEEHLSKRFVNALRIDLTKPPGPAPEAGPLVELARSGKLPSQPTAPQQPQHPTHAAAPASVSAADVVSDSFTRVADPVVPPPVRRPVHKKSGNMRLILTLLACCLLFGGGTAAGVVYFLQKDKPVVVAEVTGTDGVERMEHVGSAKTAEEAPENVDTNLESGNEQLQVEAQNPVVEPEEDVKPPGASAPDSQMQNETGLAVSESRHDAPTRNNEMADASKKDLTPEKEIVSEAMKLTPALQMSVQGIHKSEIVGTHLSALGPDTVFHLLFPVISSDTESRKFVVAKTRKNGFASFDVSVDANGIPFRLFTVTVDFGGGKNTVTVNVLTPPTDEYFPLLYGAVVYAKSPDHEISIPLSPTIRVDSVDKSLITISPPPDPQSPESAVPVHFEWKFSKELRDLRRFLRVIRETDLRCAPALEIRSDKTSWELTWKNGKYIPSDNEYMPISVVPSVSVDENIRSYSLRLFRCSTHGLDDAIDYLTEEGRRLQQDINAAVDKFLPHVSQKEYGKDKYAALKSTYEYSDDPVAQERFNASLNAARENVPSLIPGKDGEEQGEKIRNARSELRNAIDLREQVWSTQKKIHETLGMKTKMGIGECGIQIKMSSLDEVPVVMYRDLFVVSVTP